MQRRAFFHSLLFLFVAGVAPIASAATIQRFDITGIADKVIALSDGTLLFADKYGAALSRYDPVTGALTVVPLGTQQVRNPTVGADGRIWFTIDAQRQIGRYNRQTGELDRYPLPDNISGTFGGMVLGLDGSLWATASLKFL